jgi:hypothetical protein
MKNWTVQLIRKELNDLKQGCKENGDEITDDMAYDIADSFLDDNEGLSKAIKKHMGVSDERGGIANYIC